MNVLRSEYNVYPELTLSQASVLTTALQQGELLSSDVGKETRLFIDYC